MTDVTSLWEEPAILGEGPLWVERENAVYWVDIVSKKVHRYSVNDGRRSTWRFETEVTSLASRRQGGFVATIRDGFAYLNLDTGAVDPIVLPEVDVAGNRFNDGKLDAAGRYWAGSMDEGVTRDSGVLYRLDGDLALSRMDTGYIITNGPAFSVDGRTMYHTDTGRRTVFAFDVNEQGEIGAKRVFIQLTDAAEGSPDGMTVDSEDCLWLCHFGGARITRYSSKGEVIRVIPMPVPNVTSCTFGGPSLDTLYVTTARFLLDEETIARHPLAGGLFAVEPGVRGLPTPTFPG